MGEWFDNHGKPSINFRLLLQERVEKINPSRALTTEEAKRLNMLEAIADKLRRGENVQNCQLQTWLNEDAYAQIDAEWQEQIELASEAEVADVLRKVHEAADLGEFDALVEKQAQFGRRVTPKNK